MPNIGTLSVELDLKTQEYEAGLKRSKAQIDQHATSLDALQKEALNTSRSLTSASDQIVAAWGKSGDAAQTAIRKMEQISQRNAVTSGIREMKIATDEIVTGWGKTGDAAAEASEKMTYSMKEANASARTLEQLFGIHIPKALEHVITESQLLGPALAGALNVVAVLGFIEVLTRIPEVYKKIEAAVTGWDDKAKKAYDEQIKLNERYIDLLHEIELSQLRIAVSLGKMTQAQAIQQQIDSVNADLAKQLEIIKSTNEQLEKRKGVKEFFDGITIPGLVKGPDIGQQSIEELGKQLETAKNKAKELDIQLRKLQQIELPTANAEETRKAMDQARKDQTEIANIIKQNQAKLLQYGEEIQSRESAYISVLSEGYKELLTSRIKGADDYENHLEYNLQNADDIIRKNQARMQQYVEGEVQRLSTSNVALITKADEEVKKTHEDFLKASNKAIQDNLADQAKAGHELSSSLTRDFGSFIEHIGRDGQDFWRSFERLGLNSIDAIAQYAQKIKLAGGGSGGILGAIGGAAPYLTAGIGALDLGMSIGRNVGKGRNEADVFGANVLKPFQDQVGGILDLLKQSAQAGKLTTEALTQAQQNFESGWQNVLDAASKTQTDVGKQAVATLTPIVSKWREAIGGFADDAMAADQATQALSAQLQALANQQKAVADETSSVLDRILKPAGDLGPLEGALRNLQGVNTGQILGAIGDDILRMGDALTKASLPIPPMIASLYDLARAQQVASDAATQAAADQQAAMEKQAAEQKDFADSVASLIDKFNDPAGNLAAMEAALTQLSSVAPSQVIGVFGDEIMQIGDALTALGREMPPAIKSLYDYAKAQNAATEAAKRINDINDELTGVYDGLGTALNRQLDRLAGEKASLQKQILDAQNAATRQQLENTIANTSDLGEYYRAQAALRDFDQRMKDQQAKADIDEIARMQDRLSEVTHLQEVTGDIMQQIGAARQTENDLVDSSINALIERGDALEQERASLAAVAGASEMASTTFQQLAALLYQFTPTTAAVLGRYQDGTDFVPASGPYWLERGEAVIPEGGNRGGNGGLTLNFYGPVAGNMNDLADAISTRVLENHRYDVQYSSQRPASRQRAARSNRW